MWYKSDPENIRFLENELYQIRHTLLDLLPDTIQEIAGDYYHLNSRTEVYEWREKIIEATTSLASLSAEEYYYSGPRSYCPLCKRGSQGPYGGGFILPGGLRKHLLGEGNAHECPVLSQIRKLAKENWKPRIEKAEAEEKARKELEMEKRRESEELFKVNPVDSPKLCDELFLAEARDKESLEWAINRLQHLGFDETTEDRVRCFTIHYEDLIIFADPREEGRINFDTYHIDDKTINKRRRRMPPNSTFYILDTWKNDLPTKLEKRIKKAQVTLQRKIK